jgi:hypothetical protein
VKDDNKNLKRTSSLIDSKARKERDWNLVSDLRTTRREEDVITKDGRETSKESSTRMKESVYSSLS